MNPSDMTPSQWATSYNEFIDRLLEWMLAKPEAIKPCCKGCTLASCCSEPAFADRRQVDHMIEGLTPEQIEEVKANLPAWLEATVEFRKQQRPNAFAYRLKKIPCPLLKDGKCMAYERRPLDCRIFFATGSSADCELPARKHQKFADYPEATMAVFTDRWIHLGLMADGEVVMDHIGVLLAERLMGLSIPSTGRRQMKVNQ